MLKRIINKLRRDLPNISRWAKKKLFPLWFLNNWTSKIFIKLYNQSSFNYKEYLLREYIEKNETAWIPREFTFIVNFNKKNISVPVRAESFGSDMGLAFCLLGLDAPVKNVYHFVFNSLKADHNLYILDIGANFGQNLILFCSQTENVTAFEPNTSCYPELNRILQVNGYKPKILKKAIGEAPSRITLRWPKGCSWMGTIDGTAHLEALGYRDFDEEVIDVVTLDDEFSEYDQKLLLIKIDVEGHELASFKGGRNLLIKNDCLILFEHDHSRAKGRQEIWGFLKSIGYDLCSLSLCSRDPVSPLHTLEQYINDPMPNHCAVKKTSTFREFLLLNA